VREVTTSTQLAVNGCEAVCAHKMRDDAPRAEDVVAAAAAAAAAAAVAAAPAGAAEPNFHELLQQQQQQACRAALGDFVSVDSPHGMRYLHKSCLQRASITPLLALPWSEGVHRYFPPAFKASVRTFLLCHQALQATSGSGRSGGSAALAAAQPACRSLTRSCTRHSDDGNKRSGSASNLADVPSLLLPGIVRWAAPFAPQCVAPDMPAAMRPDILPVVLPEPQEPPPAQQGAGAAADGGGAAGGASGE
jgi:hypothetical protein